jgi:TRAP-type C4-dicarboxylate transport system permease small subunit
MVYHGMRYAIIQGLTQSDPVLFNLNMFFPYLSIPVCFSFIIVQLILVTFKLFLDDQLASIIW